MYALRSVKEALLCISPDSGMRLAGIEKKGLPSGGLSPLECPHHRHRIYHSVFDIFWMSHEDEAL